MPITADVGSSERVINVAAAHLRPDWWILLTRNTRPRLERWARITETYSRGTDFWVIYLAGEDPTGRSVDLCDVYRLPQRSVVDGCHCFTTSGSVLFRCDPGTSA